MSGEQSHQETKRSIGQARVFPRPLLRIPSKTRKELNVPAPGICWVKASETLICATIK
jgi:hypothetical protein